MYSRVWGSVLVSVLVGIAIMLWASQRMMGDGVPLRPPPPATPVDVAMSGPRSAPPAVTPGVRGALPPTPTGPTVPETGPPAPSERTETMALVGVRVAGSRAVPCVGPGRPVCGTIVAVLVGAGRVAPAQGTTDTGGDDFGAHRFPQPSLNLLQT